MKFKQSLRKAKSYTLLAVAFGLLPSVGFATPVLSHTVNPQDNLFHTDWGHAYNQVFDIHNSNHLDHPLDYALGAGIEASSVSYNGSAFNFSGYESVAIEASGSVQDDRSFFTDVTGDPNFLFRGAPAYSLIGIWSLDPNTIVPALGIDSILAIGSGINLDIPDLDNVYLFFGENDGWFFDNGERRLDANGDWENFYDVDLRLTEVAGATVPEPSVAALIALSLLGFRYKKARVTTHA